VPIDIPLVGRVITNAVSGPSDPSPPRRVDSIRRTSTLNMDWPDGLDGSGRVKGRARDLLTTAENARTIADDVLVAKVGPGRVYESLFTFPDRPALQAVVGVARPGNSRGAISALIPEERDAGTPLYLLLDDLPAIALVSGQVMIEWLLPQEREARMGGARRSSPVGICSGFRPGAAVLDADGIPQAIHQVQAVGPLSSDVDPLGWHVLQPEVSEPEMRRARRIDVWKEDVLRIEAFFQDSCTTPAGVRVAVHEYCLSATADLRTGELLSVVADPRILPFDSCPQAAENVDRMVGIPLAEFRSAVLTQLPGALGCTHLNDALRALAEVPGMSHLLH